MEAGGWRGGSEGRATVGRGSVGESGAVCLKLIISVM